MCLLLHHTKNTILTAKQFINFLHRNQDGWGGMLHNADKNKVSYCKTLSRGKEAWRLYKELFAGKECILHFRMATAGRVDVANCHPFAVTKQIMMAHNGVLDGKIVDTSKSDTWHFVKYILNPTLTANPKLLEDASWVKYMEGLIGSNNKIALLRNDGYLVILNKLHGVTYNGCWYSNTYAWDAPNSLKYSAGKLWTQVTRNGVTWWAPKEEKEETIKIGQTLASTSCVETHNISPT